MKYLNQISYYLFSLIPIMLISGPFLTDLSFLLISIFFLIILNKEKNFFYLNDNFAWFFSFFSLYLIINSLINFENVSKNNYFFYVRFIIYAYAISFFLRENKFIKSLIFYTFLLSILFFLDIATFKLFDFSFFGGTMYSKYRISSFFHDQLVMGSFFLRMLIIINPLFLLLYKGKYLIYLIILNLLGIYFILLSGERAAFFLFIIYVLLNFFVFNFNIKIKVIFLFSLLLILFLILINSEIFYERFILQPFILEDFLENHINLFYSSIKMFENSPILGNGYRSFQVLCSNEQFYVNQKIYCSTHPHNTYLQLMAELGLIGFLFIIIFFLYFVYEYLKSFYFYLFNKNLIRPNYFNFCITGILINFFPFTTTGNFFNNWLSCLYFFPIGIYIFLIKNK